MRRLMHACSRHGVVIELPMPTMVMFIALQAVEQGESGAEPRSTMRH